MSLHLVSKTCCRKCRQLFDYIHLLYELYSGDPKDRDGPAWGDRPVWQELHHQTPYPYYLD